MHNNSKPLKPCPACQIRISKILRVAAGKYSSSTGIISRKLSKLSPHREEICGCMNRAKGSAAEVDVHEESGFLFILMDNPDSSFYSCLPQPHSSSTPLHFFLLCSSPSSLWEPETKLNSESLCYKFSATAAPIENVGFFCFLLFYFSEI